jgi:hypothetical protein
MLSKMKNYIQDVVCNVLHTSGILFEKSRFPNSGGYGGKKWHNSSNWYDEARI